MIELWPFQEEVLSECRQAIKMGYRSILIVAPTGAGKTVIGAKIIQNADDKMKQSIFTAHRRELVKQCAQKLWDFGVQHGIIMAGEPLDQWKGVQIASVDTLRSRYLNPKKTLNFMNLPKVAILMVDEAHRSCSPTYTKIIDFYKAEGTIIIGLTATPIRGDGKGLARHYDYMVQAPGMAELIEMGYLVQPRYYAPTIPDLTGVKVARGDYVEEQLQPIMDTREAIGDVVTNFMRICPERKTIVYAAGVRHSIHVAEQFREAGVAAEHVDGTTDIEDRKAILGRLETGETQLVSNCMVLTEGYDCPSLECGIILRPTRNLGLFIQMGGRPLRCFPGKNDAFIIDHSGNIYEHGFLEDDHNWQLLEGEACKSREERQKELDERKPITCKECGHVYTGQLPCPACGHVPVKRGEYIETRHADLIEIRREKREKAAEQAKKRMPATMEEKQHWYSMFLHYAREKGHKQGSVSHKYKAKFDVWPKDMKKVEVEPTPECKAYIQHLNIKNFHRNKAIKAQKYQEIKDNYVPSAER